MTVEKLKTNELGVEEVSELMGNVNATLTETNEQKEGLFAGTESEAIHAQMVGLGVTGETFEKVGDRLERWAAHIDTPTKLSAAKSERDLMIRMAVELSIYCYRIPGCQADWLHLN